MSINELYRYFDENKLYPEDIRETYDDLHDITYIVVSIHWGDWKHEHKRCDWLMSDLGYVFMDAVETEEDGSDCYSADRYYLSSADYDKSYLM